MISMTIPEASLFRVLVSIFGADNVIYNISAATIYGGTIPSNYACRYSGKSSVDVNESLSGVKCLFTVLDDCSNPRMVVNFEHDSSDEVIDLESINSNFILRGVLTHFGIHFVTISHKELSDILTINDFKEFCEFIQSKVELSMAT